MIVFSFCRPAHCVKARRPLLILLQSSIGLATISIVSLQRYDYRRKSEVSLLTILPCSTRTNVVNSRLHPACPAQHPCLRWPGTLTHHATNVTGCISSVTSDIYTINSCLNISITFRRLWGIYKLQYQRIDIVCPTCVHQYQQYTKNTIWPNNTDISYKHMIRGNASRTACMVVIRRVRPKWKSPKSHDWHPICTANWLHKEIGIQHEPDPYQCELGTWDVESWWRGVGKSACVIRGSVVRRIHWGLSLGVIDFDVVNSWLCALGQSYRVDG